MDFVNKDYGTTVHCSAVASDGYESTNLLHKNSTEEGDFHEARSLFTHSGKHQSVRYDNGFMADYFVKPPVDVVVQFPCLVDIHRVIVNRKSGEKRLADFIVLVANAKPIFKSKSRECGGQAQDSGVLGSLSQPDGKDVKGGENESIPSSTQTNNSVFNGTMFRYEPDFAQTEVRKQSLSALHMVGKFTARNGSADVITFSNPKINSSSNHYESPASSMQTLSLFSLQYLYGASHAIIRIFRTEGSTVPAIKRLEIWGRPSHRNQTVLNKHVYELIRKFKEKNLKKLDFSKPTDNFPKKKECKNYQGNADINQRSNGSGERYSGNSAESCWIPEDFIDPITLDVMQLPLLLPSGHTVDSTTLERSIKEDERNGRVALDPFTGVPLNAENKAVPNTALKLRLDSFLLQNQGYLSQHYNVSKQTVGVKSPNSAMVARVTNNRWKKRSCGSEIVTGNRDLNERLSKRVKVSSLVDKTIQEPNVLHNNVDCVTEEDGAKSSEKWTQELEKADVRRSDRSTVPFAKNNASNGNGLFSSKLSHEETLKHSLEAALQQIVKPIFRQQGKEKKQSNSLCSVCKVFGKDINFFQLPCKHITCRKCMEKKCGIQQCNICLRHFSNEEVRRVHFSEYFEV